MKSHSSALFALTGAIGSQHPTLKSSNYENRHATLVIQSGHARDSRHQHPRCLRNRLLRLCEWSR